jgi:hypothetical protein
MSPTRREFVAGALATGAALRAEAAARPSFRDVLSVGLNAEHSLDAGIVFTDGRRTARDLASLQRLFVAHGSTEVYTRIGTNRSAAGGPVETCLARGLERARLAKALDLALDPEIGLWIVYGGLPDFREYPELKVPGPWTRLSTREMAPVVRGFGAIVAREILATGVTVNVWHLSGDERGVGGLTLPRLGPFGNETPYRPPDGVDPAIGRVDVAGFEAQPQSQRIAWYEANLWPHTARLWAALAEGIRSVDPAARFTTHVGSGSRPAYEPALIKAFFRTLEDNGYRVDQPGACFFPSNAAAPHDRMAAFRASIGEAHSALGRPFFIAEHAYPVRPFSIGEDWGHATPGYPLSREGQARLTRDLVAWGVRTGALAGLRQWSPESADGGWAPMSLFDLKGRTATARPSLDSVRLGLGAARGDGPRRL